MKKVKFIVILLLVFGAVFTGYHLNDTLNKKKYVSAVNVIEIPHAMRIINKVMVQDAVVSEVRKSQKIIVMEVDLSQDVVYDDSYLDIDFLAKSQQVTYAGKAAYTVDLEQFHKEDFILNENEKTLIFRIQKPDVYSLAISEEDTVYHDTNRGLLRFGDVTLTPTEFDTMALHAKGIMKEQLYTDEILSQVESQAISTVKELLINILSLSNLKDYEIIVEFKVD